MGLLPFGVVLSITYLTYISFFMLKFMVYIMSYIKSVSSVNSDTFNQRIAQPWDFSGLHNICFFIPPYYFFAAIPFYAPKLFCLARLHEILSTPQTLSIPPGGLGTRIPYAVPLQYADGLTPILSILSLLFSIIYVWLAMVRCVLCGHVLACVENEYNLITVYYICIGYD